MTNDRATAGSISPLEQAIAGAVGAIFANALVYPLDIVKTRLQIQVKSGGQYVGDVDGVAQRPRHQDDDGVTASPIYGSAFDALSRIVSTEGLAGLYVGIGGSLVGVASTNFAYFYWYSSVRSLYAHAYGHAKSPSTAIELSLGAVAGAIAQFCTIPIAVVTTRQQTSAKRDRKGLAETTREIVTSEDGISGLWRGLRASIVLVVNPAITYGVFEKLRNSIVTRNQKLKPLQAFLLGALAKTLATVATHPLIVAKVGLQSKPPPARDGVPFRSFGEVLRFIWTHEGLAGLFKGIGPQVLKGFLVQGILMMTKDKMEILLVALFRYIRSMYVHLQSRSNLGRIVRQRMAANPHLIYRAIA